VATAARRVRRCHGQIQSLIRAARYRFVIPIFRSRHPPEFTAGGVANGVFWALTPSVGIQSLAILASWFVARTALRRDSSLLQAFIWAWINNPLTMIPMYYIFYVTGLLLLGQGGESTGYAVFASVWDASSSVPWFDRLASIGRAIGVPTVLGSLPYAVAGGLISYRWALRMVRRRRERLSPVA
jgi:uncharacterized protein (DUF2062 family)